MNSQCKEFIDYILNDAPKHNKERVEQAVYEKFKLIKDRKVLHNNNFAVRFCYSKKSSESFSNTVLSLSALEKYDDIPFFVVLVRRDADNLVLLANTSFIHKLSHSSRGFSATNIKGSFNGSDIIRQYNGIDNRPANFDNLFDIHSGLDWEDNLIRLVDTTSKIKPQSTKFIPTENEMQLIFGSVNRALSFITSESYMELYDDLNSRCERCKNEITVASLIENTNIRGRLIESLITADETTLQFLRKSIKDLQHELPVYDTRNGLGDYSRSFDNADTFTDIKTKVVYLSSNPKAFNIDKFLRHMAMEKSVFLFFFIGIDEDGIFNTALCSVYHTTLIDNMITQDHWSGRSTRGVVQLKGAAIDKILYDKDFKNTIDPARSETYLRYLLSL